MYGSVAGQMGTNNLFPFAYKGSIRALSDSESLGEGYWWVMGTSTNIAVNDSGFILILSRGVITMHLFFPANNQDKVLYRYRVSQSSGFGAWTYFSSQVL